MDKRISRAGCGYSRSGRGAKGEWRAAGEQEVLFRLPNETIAVIDELKQRLGLRNRGQVLVQLVEQREEAAQQ